MRTMCKADGVVWSVKAAILAATVLTSATRAAADDTTAEANVDIAVAWDSRYVSEGRDNLDGDSLAGTTVEASFSGLSLGIWVATSPDADYREFKIGATYKVEWHDFEAYVSLTHLRFLSDEDEDNEIGAGLAYSALPAGLSIGLDASHSFEADGAFLEVSLGGEYAVCDWLTLAPAAVLGWNSGFIADGHDGANHFALSLEASVPLKDGLDLTATVAYTWAIDADPGRYPGDDALKDFLHGGIALRGAF